MRTLIIPAILVALTAVAGAQTPPAPNATTPPITPPTTQTTPPATPPASPAQRAPSESSVQPLTSIPANAGTVTHWYKQPIYDQGNNRIGDVDDVLVDH